MIAKGFSPARRHHRLPGGCIASNLCPLIFALFPISSPPATSPRPSIRFCRGSRAERDQVLLGVTGSGKTFTMAQVISGTAKAGPHSWRLIKLFAAQLVLAR